MVVLQNLEESEITEQDSFLQLLQNLEESETTAQDSLLQKEKAHRDYSNCGEIIIENIIQWLGPKEACQSILLSRAFRSPAQSDYVWEQWLTANYLQIIDQSDDKVELLSISKKKLYSALYHDMIPIDDGTKYLKLDPANKRCYFLPARSLVIWHDSSARLHWDVMEMRIEKSSRTMNVANLENFKGLIAWGEVNTHELSKDEIYVVYLIYRWGDGAASGMDCAEGEVSIIGNEVDRNVINLPLADSSEWMKVKLGEYLVPGDHDLPAEIVFLKIRWQSKSVKSGLLIGGIIVRPRSTDYDQLGDDS